MSHNQIVWIDFPDYLRRQLDLETLELNSNSDFPLIKNKTEMILEHDNLRKFSCKVCGFTEIGNLTFRGMPSLEVLLLNANKIEEIAESSFELNTNMKELDLSDNKIKVLHPETLTNLKKFTQLTLTLNPIELPDNRLFLKSESLKSLAMDRCGVKVIYPETFGELKNLEKLNINGNFIENIPVNSFKLNKKLKSLLIESNQMRFFPNVLLDYSPKLEELCIDNNKFDESALEFGETVEKYNARNLRSDNCNNDERLFIEFLYKATTTIPPATTTFSEDRIIRKFEGISDFFIGSYLSIILIIQATAFVLLAIYLIKIVKYEKLDGGDVDLSNTFLNDNDIYKVWKNTE
ncbi:unnamed protein product [Diamesa serratosioi]